VTGEFRLLGEEDLSHGQGSVGIRQTFFSQGRVDYLYKSR